MTFRRLVGGLLALALVMTLAGESRADISNAAVLYLRIAPGARAAGMGEAYVAIADDATATHWNPAGLGAYPLADAWIESKIPQRFRPLGGLAAIEARSGSDYLAYELWAITPMGLARYDNQDWYLDETFRTKTDQTVEDIVRRYFNESDEERLSDMVSKVAAATNRKSYTYLDSLVADVLRVFPSEEEYDDRETAVAMLDTLLMSYEECRINWTRVDQLAGYLSDAMRDSSMTETEADRITIAAEKARTRFIPEELTIPYSVNFQGEPKMLASNGDHLLVGTDYGLAVYNGKRWDYITAEDGLPSDTITCLAQAGGDILVGTSAGPARYAGMRLAGMVGVATLPSGPVTALGARDLDNIWMILGGELYHYDGRDWSTTIPYQTLLDDTPEAIAERFSIYGTEAEKAAWLEQYQQVNAATGGWGIDYVPDESETSREITGDLMSMMQREAAQDADASDTTGSSEEEALPEITPVEPGQALEPGKVVRAPIAADIKGRVNAIFVGREFNVWIGTEYGLLFFDGKGWDMPGYRRYRLKPEDSFDDLVDAKLHDDDAARQAYADQLTAVNNFDEEPMEVGRVIKIYRNPNASEIRSIVRSGRRLYLSTEEGLVEYDGVYWARAAVQDLGLKRSVQAHTVHDELWLVSDDKVTIKASARNQFTLMHVKWLPELADDVYYEFLSYVFGTEGWGTFGGNITFITYGTMKRTSQFGDTLEDFTSYDLAITGSYGAALSNNLKVGLSAKVMYSKLSDIGTGLEKGRGTSTGFAVDFGILYDMTRRLTWGAAITNVGPKMAYIDASQADELPRNLAVGLRYTLLESDYYTLMATTEANKIMVGLDDGLSEELKQMVINSGAEFEYAGIFALRAGYIFDQEGDVKTPTLGVGLALANRYKFDFSYIPSGSNEALKNTLRISLSVLP